MLYGTHSIGESHEKSTAIGVLAYYIGNIDKTLAVMYDDPHQLHNTWNIRLYDGEKEANHEMFSDLHENDPITTTGIKHISLGSSLKAIGSISSVTDNKVTLEIHVHSIDVRKVM